MRCALASGVAGEEAAEVETRGGVRNGAPPAAPFLSRARLLLDLPPATGGGGVAEGDGRPIRLLQGSRGVCAV